MGEFKIGSKAKFLEPFGYYSKGEIIEITKVKNDGTYPSVDYKGQKGSGWVYQRRLELIEPKRTKNQRITALENEVAELKVIVEGLRKSKFNVEADAATVAKALAETLENVIEFEGEKYRKVEREAREGDVVVLRKNTSVCLVNNESYLVAIQKGQIAICDGENNYYDLYSTFYNRTPETVDVYERIEPSTSDEVAEKSPNELRAEVIEKAKGFESSVTPSFSGGVLYEKWDCKVEYVINEEKRTIVALLRGYNSGMVRSKGLAKCNPNDVFNEHIGKAIALGRALGLDVSEFEEAVQPSKVVVGMKTYQEWSHDYWDITAENIQYVNDYHKIINDTNAFYKEDK